MFFLSGGIAHVPAPILCTPAPPPSPGHARPGRCRVGTAHHNPSKLFSRDAAPRFCTSVSSATPCGRSGVERQTRPSLIPHPSFTERTHRGSARPRPPPPRKPPARQELGDEHHVILDRQCARQHRKRSHRRANEPTRGGNEATHAPTNPPSATTPSRVKCWSLTAHCRPLITDRLQLLAYSLQPIAYSCSPTASSRIHSSHEPGKGDGLADVFEAADPGYGALDA